MVSYLYYRLLNIENELSHMNNELMNRFSADFVNNFNKAESLHEEIVDGANSILQLSQSNRRELESVSRRLKLVQSSKPLKETTLDNLRPLSDLDPVNNQEFLSQSLPSGWERRMEQGIPYYVNHR